MADHVREPIQAYLTTDERAELDRLAAELGVSRSEALRRGIQALGGAAARRGGSLRDLVREGAVTPATAGPGEPPPSRPVATLAELLDELDRDRGER